jgi:methyl-accepting chemotaxis protein
MMRHLSVYSRFVVIISVLSVVFAAAIASQVMILRRTVVEERETKVHDLVDAAKKIFAFYDAKARAGEIQPADARKLAFEAIGAMRWGQQADYLGDYGAGSQNAGVTYVHPNPKYINVNRWDYKDAQGRLLIQDIVRKAQNGEGFVEYGVPRSAGGPEAAKLSFVGGYGTGETLLAIQAGVYVDDIDAVIFNRAMWIVAVGLTGLLIAGLVAYSLGRGLVRPLNEICGVMDGLAAGDLATDIPHRDQRNEVGRICRSLGVFKDALVAADQLRVEQSDREAAQLARRRADMNRLANEFEGAVGKIIKTVSTASIELESAAGSLSATAERSQELTDVVAGASEEASANVHSVASATEQMSSSVSEISRQVQASAKIASEAVQQAKTTNAQVGELSKAADRIGDVVELINTIAGQTNLLALNATIEAARAGDAGRGFAVVAAEVKALAEQTAKATDEISQQVSGIQGATRESVQAIQTIGNTIERISAIASTIAAAVEQQGAATKEISRNVQHAANGTSQVSANILDVKRGAGEIGQASLNVLSAARSLSGESSHLKADVETFLSSVRSA